MRIVNFKKIKFIDIKSNKINYILKNKGLYVFPSAPGLASIEEEKKYYDSLRKANYVFFDSSYFVILLKFLKNIKVERLSGYKFLKFFFLFIKKNKKHKIFLIDPSLKKSINNLNYLRKLNLNKNKIKSYIAPLYDPKNIDDKDLIKKINKFKPEVILINIGGGTQEILGSYIYSRIKFKTRIICTGAAISFFTGDQAPINDLIDKLYLGWLLRLIYNPFTFFKRYLYALKLFRIVYKNSVYLKLN